MEERKTFIEKYAEERDKKKFYDKIQPIIEIIGSFLVGVITTIMYLAQAGYVILCIYFLTIKFGIVGLASGIFALPIALITCPFFEIFICHTFIILGLGLTILAYWGIIFLIAKHSDKRVNS